MSKYLFHPIVSKNQDIGEYVFWQQGFSDNDIKAIIALGENRNPLQATIDRGRVVKDVRISNTSWIDLQEDSVWLYDRICDIVCKLNYQYYKFDLSGFYEHMQFTIYEGNELGHYDWHLDNNLNSDSPPRKLSFVLQLSDPNDYEGGDLQLMHSTNPVTVKKEKGLVVVFPSFTLHRVTPVTKGIRKTLVVWVTGPSFR
jgi:PKHD-type hydroxylase